MPLPDTLERVPLRDRIYEIVRGQILRGELAPGSPVRDSSLAESLGASRTPVREALIRLTAEGLLQNLVGRGFRVAPLVRREVEEVFPLLWTLEPLALESSPSFTKKRLGELERIVRRMGDSRASAQTRHEADADWHRCLIGGCSNSRLLRWVEQLRGVMHRYETAYLEGVVGMDQSIDEHRAIVAALVDGDRTDASALLREHWRRGRGELLAIIQEQGSNKESE